MTLKDKAKDVLKAWKAVQTYDERHGYGADDEGYNLLADLREYMAALEEHLEKEVR